jgi:hypothetical protein
MLAGFFFFAMIVAAVPVSRRLWVLAPAGDRAGPCERIASIGLVALALAVGIDWILAFTHLFFRGALVAVAAALVAWVVWDTTRERVVRRRSAEKAPPLQDLPARRPGTLVSLVVLSPIGLWLAYIFWCGTILFVYLSDGLSYHLPKALFLVRHRGYAMFEGQDARLTTFPANYEILLADVIALTGKDTLTFVVSMLGFVLFGLMVAAVAERWWSTDHDGHDGLLHVAAPTLLALAMPPALLATGAHKNDLVTNAAMLAALHWGARWAVTAQRPALVLAIAGAALAFGTKVNAGVLAIALVPCLVWRARAFALRKQRQGRGLVSELLPWVGVSLLAFLVLGGGVYVFNMVKIGRPIGVSESAGGYGAWNQLWQFPLIVFLRGLTWADQVWIPWLGVHWSWPQYDLFFAPFGTPTSLLLLALPLALWRYRADGRRDERALVSLMVVIAFVVTLPVRANHEPPVGFFIGIGRYVLSLPVIILLWTVAPFVRRLSTRRPRLAASAALLTSGVFVSYAVGCALRAPGAYLGFVRSVHDGLLPPRTLAASPKRAGQIVDERAAPDAVVAFEGAFDSWVYPIFGASLSRRVVFLHSDRGPVKIPANVSWVAIDRWWHCAFGSPEFTDFSQWQHFLEGTPEPADLVVYNQLLADPHFQLVFRSDRTNQAVFMRIAP